MTTTTILTTLVHEECCNCHVVFGMESRHRQRLIDNGKSFYCPSGHEQHYSQSTVQKLKSQLEQESARLARERERRLGAEKESEYFRKSRDGMKGALVKAKKRAVAGVCPCCTRTFQNVARHMETKHPEAALTAKKEGS